MKNIVFAILILFCCNVSVAQKTENYRINLYPNGVTETNGLSGDVQGVESNCISNISNPYMCVYLPEAAKSTRQAVVICPGGGYSLLAFAKEGTDVAKWLNNLGIAAIVVAYRMPNGHSEVALSDVLKAITLTRENADKWNIDKSKVGVMGFSAGGHLAASATVHYSGKSDRPDFSVLIYPVITMDETYTHFETRKELIGSKYNKALVDRFSCEKCVTRNTPPVFITSCTDDKTVDVRNSIEFCKALTRRGIPVEMHLYPEGDHGWGWDVNRFPYREEFYTALSRWLKNICIK